MNLEQEPSFREKIYFAAVLGGLMLLFVNVFWEPQAEKIKTERSTLNGIKLEVDAVKLLIDFTKNQLAMQQMEAPKQQIEINEKVKRVLERKVVDPQADIHSTVGLLAGKRFSRKVKIDDISIGNALEKETYSMVPMTIQLRGRYGNIQSYFIALERIDRPLVVKRFTFRDDKDNTGLIKATLDIELYIVKE